MPSLPANPFERHSLERQASVSFPQHRAFQRVSKSPASPEPADGITRWPRPENAASAFGRKRLLIVCTANICRSPMVAGILQQRFEAGELADKVDIRSSGVYGLEGEPASREGIELLAERDIDISGHTASLLQPPDVEASDLVVVMEEAHRKAIIAYSLDYAHKVILFSELAGGHTDMPDPYRKGKRAYVRTLEIIDDTLDAGWENLIKRLGLPTG
ncbi:MAG: hypothetical protein KDD92_11350 [Caldilineaceae bacterium]|nr:hypothetical protein [Caldilineaceae bacterium]